MVKYWFLLSIIESNHKFGHWHGDWPTSLQPVKLKLKYVLSSLKARQMYIFVDEVIT